MIYDYIAEADAICKNSVDYEIKRGWLDRLEGKLRDHLGAHIPEAFSSVGVPPYDDIYVPYLCMKICEVNGDNFRYNNFLAAFKEARDELYAFYVRTYPVNAGGWKNVL